MRYKSKTSLILNPKSETTLRTPAVILVAAVLLGACVQTGSSNMACISAGLYMTQQACQQATVAPACVMTPIQLDPSAKTAICWKPDFGQTSTGGTTAGTVTGGATPTPSVSANETQYKSYPFPEYSVLNGAAGTSVTQRFNGNNFCRRSGTSGSNPVYSYSCYQVTTLSGAAQYAAISAQTKAVTIGALTVYEKESADGLQMCQYIGPLATAKYYCFQKQ